MRGCTLEITENASFTIKLTVDYENFTVNASL